jgi:hypothetical protein
VDIGGHPPIPLAGKTIFHLGSFSGSKLLGSFEGLNDVFWGFGAQVTTKGNDLGQSKIVLLSYNFPTGYHAPKT